MLFLQIQELSNMGGPFEHGIDLNVFFALQLRQHTF